MNARSMLHLASRSLLSSPSLNVDYDLHYSPRFRTEERVEFGGWPVLGSRHIEIMEDCWPQRRDLTGGTLDRLADVESFRIASEEEITNMVGVLRVISVYLGVSFWWPHTIRWGRRKLPLLQQMAVLLGQTPSTTKGVHGAGN